MNEMPFSFFPRHKKTSAKNYVLFSKNNKIQNKKC